MNSNTIGTKVCTRCKVAKSFDDFTKNKLGKFGLNPRCSKCNSEYSKEYIKKNPKWYKAYHKNYVRTEKYKKKRREYDRKLMQDPLHRLSNNLRGNMYHALKAMKGFRRWRDLVGYGLDDLATHLESKFTPGISWDNYGSEWHVDHIVPKSWFKYTSTDDPKFKECWALSNLQPKLSTDNRRKGNRFSG